MLCCMTTERDILPLHERQAATSAIRELVDKHGSQAAAGAVLGVSQNAINKAMLYTKVGPSVMRVLLEHLGTDVPGLLDKYGDPATRPARAATGAAPAPSPALSPKEEAIQAAVRYGGGVREKEVRELADRLESYLGDATTLVWVETLLGEVRKNLMSMLEKKAATRAKKSEQRVIRNVQEARASEVAQVPVVPKKKATR